MHACSMRIGWFAINLVHGRQEPGPSMLACGQHMPSRGGAASSVAAAAWRIAWGRTDEERAGALGDRAPTLPTGALDRARAAGRRPSDDRSSARCSRRLHGFPATCSVSHCDVSAVAWSRKGNQDKTIDQSVDKTKSIDWNYKPVSGELLITCCKPTRLLADHRIRSMSLPQQYRREMM
jgi:hypothetical protein